MTQVWYHPVIDRIVTRKISSFRALKTFKDIWIAWSQFGEMEPIRKFLDGRTMYTDSGMRLSGWKKLGKL